MIKYARCQKSSHPLIPIRIQGLMVCVPAFMYFSNIIPRKHFYFYEFLMFISMIYTAIYRFKRASSFMRARSCCGHKIRFQIYIFSSFCSLRLLRMMLLLCVSYGRICTYEKHTHTHTHKNFLQLTVS